ncbi:peptidylprolyl isomerase [Rhodoferax sp.]|uniref:peptidylprolyl isomerase n=1 Tax=Rhodoferax sp. TaxID=50421 RepID=UPI002632799B|nr:peptidylprolyl isomerase [Rhodoferax sp.]MDD4944980.1 peptidylprolyl isomerase [Rhodoferax sp.]MDD5478683.1 peptidylprolyl isomerase [Rhodoferax sp.]
MKYKSFTALARTAVACIALYSVASLAQAEAVRQVKLATSQGDIVLELYPERAPQTVENFVQYVKDKHYDGTIFHRVIGSFMIQGGGFDANYVQKPTRAPVVHEGRAAMAKGLHNVAGTVAMARTSDPQSASAQFFINVADNRRLDPTFIPPGDPVPEFEYNGEVFKNTPRAELLNARKLFGYTVFGKVISGMDVVDKIKATPTGAGGPFGTDVPKTPILINSATLVK